MRVLLLVVAGALVLSSLPAAALAGAIDQLTTYWLGVFAGSIFSACTYYIVIPELGISVQRLLRHRGS